MDSSRPESSLSPSKERPAEKRDRSPEFWSRSTHTTHTTPAGIFITFWPPRGPFSTHTTPTTVANLDSERDSDRYCGRDRAVPTISSSPGSIEGKAYCVGSAHRRVGLAESGLDCSSLAGAWKPKHALSGHPGRLAGDRTRIDQRGDASCGNGDKPASDSISCGGVERHALKDRDAASSSASGSKRLWPYVKVAGRAHRLWGSLLLHRLLCLRSVSLQGPGAGVESGPQELISAGTGNPDRGAA